jgi:hypothetical protein
MLLHSQMKILSPWMRRSPPVNSALLPMALPLIY